MPFRSRDTVDFLEEGWPLQGFDWEEYEICCELARGGSLSVIGGTPACWDRSRLGCDSRRVEPDVITVERKAALARRAKAAIGLAKLEKIVRRPLGSPIFPQPSTPGLEEQMLKIEEEHRWVDRSSGAFLANRERLIREGWVEVAPDIWSPSHELVSECIDFL